jgi:putative transposase
VGPRCGRRHAPGASRTPRPTRRWWGGASGPAATVIGLSDVVNLSQDCGTMSGSRPTRRRLPHDIPSWVPDGEIYFLTICARERGESVLMEPAGRLVESAVFYHQIQRWHLHLIVVMPDHLHLLASFPATPGLRTTVSAWKSFTAKESGFRWQTDFFEHRLRAEESFDEKAHYVRMNPVRAGLCEAWTDWPHRWPQ